MWLNWQLFTAPVKSMENSGPVYTSQGETWLAVLGFQLFQLKCGYAGFLFVHNFFVCVVSTCRESKAWFQTTLELFTPWNRQFLLSRWPPHNHTTEDTLKIKTTLNSMLTYCRMYEQRMLTGCLLLYAPQPQPSLLLLLLPFWHTLNNIQWDDLRASHVGESRSAGRPRCRVPALCSAV